MEISINGKPADIRPESEKTLGEILAALEQWLDGSGRRLSGLRVNGETIGASAMEAAFGRSLEDISTLELSVSFWPDLAAEALSQAGELLRDWAAAPFEDRPRFREAWEQSAAAPFLSAGIPDIFALAEGAFRGEGPGPAELAGLIDERLREMENPAGELILAENAAAAAAGRLEELPLDVQTGKDGRAAETVRLFSGITEKLFRLLSLLKMYGFVSGGFLVEGRPARDFIGEFSAALGELLAAYGAGDTVLAGDLAEYELAPRLRGLYGALKNSLADAV